MALFERLWAVIKEAERDGGLTVEDALDVATRMPQALYASMMECLKENGEDPQVLLVQVERLHEHMRVHLTEVARALRATPASPVH